MDLKESKLAGLVGRLKEAAHENLQAVVLYGSAARGDHREGVSDLNVLCVMQSLSAGELKRIAPAMVWWVQEQKEPAPLLFTGKELLESADVFAIELTDLQRHRRVLYGKDVVAGIHVPMNLHRVQVEHELRTTLLKLRQHFVFSAGDAQALRVVMSKAISSVRTLAAHALLVMGEQPAVGAQEIFAQVAAKTGADAKAFQAVLELRDRGQAAADVSAIAQIYGGFLKALETVTEALDRHHPKAELRRAAK
jgi:predicted nucleotidyltransferase